jgi:hypothetical protein
MYLQYPLPTLIAQGPKRGKEQLNRVRHVLKKHDIEFYKTSPQTEQTRGIPGQTDRILLLNKIINQTVRDLEAELGNTMLRLEIWPYMPP